VPIQESPHEQERVTVIFLPVFLTVCSSERE